jgi:peptidoglycan/xylan/chitin deacetylase (PgdA/CDA1 family)
MTSTRLRFTRFATAAVVVAAMAATVVALPGAAEARTVKGCAAPKSGVVMEVPATYKKNVALTFDDGPSKFTPMILDVLKKRGVKATFFVDGRAAAANPALVRRIVAEATRSGTTRTPIPRTWPAPCPASASRT